MAAPSPSAIRSECLARASRSPRPRNYRGKAESWASRPCALASDRESLSHSNGCRFIGVIDVAMLDEAAVMAVVDEVMDPEIPVVSVTDLGIIRGLADNPPRVLITPTYPGCPATIAI